ncbi:MAG: hypothetical protein H6747_02055 [Deltaproteobacteria bacterium]|nr:hypothetical protein [Deltaproteobacteria bacterium]
MIRQRLTALAIGWTLSLLAAAGLAHAPIVAAALRHTVHLPLPLGVLVAVALLGGLLWAMRHTVARMVAAPQRQIALAAATLLGALACAAAVDALWLPFGGEPATVGGGDLGHHLHIAALLEGPMPRVYLGFVGWHATTMAVFRALGAPPAGLLQAGWIATWLGLLASLVIAACWLATLVVRVVERSPGSAGGAAPRVRASLAVGLGVAVGGLLLWQAHHAALFAAWHYHPAEGFVAHAHATLPLLAAAWLWTVVPAGWPALIAAGGCVVALRFTYGLNLPEHAAAVAALAAWQAKTIAAAPKWQTRARWGIALTSAVVAVGIAWVLAGSFGKPGGLMHPELELRVQSLGVVVLAPLAAWALGERRLALWLAALTAGPLIVALLHLAVPSLPREYYLWKHGVHAEWIGAIALAGLAGAAAARAVRAPTWRAFGLALALVGVAAALPQLLAEAQPRLQRSYRERSEPGYRLAVAQALRDRSFEQVMQRLAKRGRRVAAVLHPHWPLSSVWQSEREGTQELQVAPVAGLQELRWAAFRDGPASLPTDGCVVIAAGRHRRAAWSSHARRNGGPAGEKALAWLAGPGVHCAWGPTPRRGTWRERTCWRCPSPPASAQSPGATTAP